MISRYRIPLGGVFSLMVLMTTVPLGLFAAGLIVASWRQQGVMVARQNIEVARAISVAIDLEVERSIGALTVLSSFIPSDGGDYRAFYDVTTRIAPQQEWEAVRLVSPTGAVLIATDAPFGAGPTVLDESWVREAVTTRRPVVSAARKDPNLDSWVVSIGIPVVRNGTVTSVLSALVQARAFGEILRRQHTPPGGVVTLFDQTPAIVGRTQDEDTLAGRPPMAEFLERSQSSSEGALQTTTREGVRAYAAWSRSALTGWTIGISLPAATVAGPARRSLFALTAAGVAIGALGLACAVVVRRRLVAAQRAVATIARALARGERILPPESSIAELQDLSAALREAGAILAMRKDERDQAQREADSQQRALRDAIAEAISRLRAGPLTPSQQQALEIIDRNTTAQSHPAAPILEKAPGGR